jgi:hypothetical protein
MFDLGGEYSAIADLPRVLEALAERLAAAVRGDDSPSPFLTSERQPEAAPIDLTPVGKLNSLFRQLRSRTRIPPVLLIDGLERVEPLSLVFLLMRELERVECSTVLAVRLTTQFVQEFVRFRDDWEQAYLPAVPLYTQDRRGVEDAGWRLLRSVIERRAGQDVFQKEALRTIIASSGGIHRELIWAASYACLIGHQRKKTTVTEEDAEVAVQQLRLKHTPSLAHPTLTALESFVKGKRELINESLLELVDRSYLVGYHGRTGWWWDAHPVIFPLLGITPPDPPREF